LKEKRKEKKIRNDWRGKRVSTTRRSGTESTGGKLLSISTNNYRNKFWIIKE